MRIFLLILRWLLTSILLLISVASLNILTKIVVKNYLNDVMAGAGVFEAIEEMSFFRIIIPIIITVVFIFLSFKATPNKKIAMYIISGLVIINFIIGLIILWLNNNEWDFKWILIKISITVIILLANLFILSMSSIFADESN